MSAQQPPPKPSFQSSVEVTSLDVNVVDDKGKPLVNLAPADFAVKIDGNTCRVLTAEWVPLVVAAGEPPPPPPDGYSTNESSTGGRLIIIAIDQPNIRFGGALAIAKAANAFVDKLTPSDRVAVAGIGAGAPATVFTSDRARIKQTISRMVGQKTPTLSGQHTVAISEVMAFETGDQAAMNAVFARECAGLMRLGDVEACKSDVETEARSLAGNVRHEGNETMQALAALFAGLRTIDAPKTLILITEGFVSIDSARIVELGAMAAASRTSLYALRLDNQLFDITSARSPVNPFADRVFQGEALELLASSARGTLFNVNGTGEALFDRIASELSGYYLLGVEADGREKDGKPHPIRVEVARKGALVRARRQLINVASDRGSARSPRAGAMAALNSPLLATALPVRVASFALQGPERDKVQLLLHADVGADYPASKVVSINYVITDRAGKMVDSKSADMRLLPVMNGVPSALQYTSGASLPPGDYTLKLAVAEGDRVGSVEHLIHAALPSASGVTLSELMVGGPLQVEDLATPTIGYQVNFGAVHGYVEVYGSSSGGTTLEYEVATAPDAPALLNTDVPGRKVGDSRIVFSKVMNVYSLPPGAYVLRAILSGADGAAVKTLTRGFAIAPPKVLLTSAEGLGNVSVDAELFLPIDEATMHPAFQREAAIEEVTLAPFRERVTPSVKDAFDQGVAFLAVGDWAKAEASFKKAIEPDVDSTSPLTFLAASFAAGGKDQEAASAWQTALVDGSEFPQIYQWLADALLRVHDLPAARAILEEASAKWPADVRFLKPLAMLYGTFGRGREAVRTLERYLDERTDDRDAYFFAVQWLYTVRSGGAVVHSRVEDGRRAHEYSDAYTKARGPQAALVKQWVDFLDAQK